MKFPDSLIDVKKYKLKINTLLSDPECIIFIDTNIIALFFGINDSARKDFFDWLKKLIAEERIKLPIWVVNEYTNRFIRNQLSDFTNPLKKISTIKKEYNQAEEFLKKYIQDSNLSNSEYSNVKEFQIDLELISEKLKKIQSVTKNKANNEKIHDEIQKELQDCIIQTNLNEVLSKVNELGDIRYNHKLPPGFKDEKKESNSFGDLILWYEILDYCKKENKKKVILLSNDEKNDWVYAPYKIYLNNRKVSNPKDDLIKIADPRLVHEFKTVTNSEEFYIVNFEFLTKILIDNYGNSFNNLALALQSKNINVTTSTKDKNDNKTTAQSSNQKDCKSNLNERNINFDYSDLAFSDKDFPLINDDFLTTSILELQSYNWYKQNPAIDDIVDYNFNSLTNNQHNSDLLFVLGRNIYQSAIGASASAIDFLFNIKEHFRKKTDYFINHVFSGMVYEIYFDSSNQFRGDNLKSYYLEKLIDLFDLERLKKSIEFITKSLKPFENKLIFLPYSKDNIKFDISIEEKDIDNTKKDDKTCIYIVKELKVNGLNILTMEKNHSLNVYIGSQNYLGLIDLVCKTYAIPKGKIILSEKNRELDKKIKISLEGKRLATTTYIKNNNLNT